MKKRNIALIVSAFVFVATSVLVGCSDKNDSSVNSSEPQGAALDSSESEVIPEETQPDPHAPTEAATEAVTEVVTETASEEGTTEAETAAEGEETEPEDDLEPSDEELISTAQTLFDNACETNWNFYVGSPYTLDYDSSVQNSLGWEYYLITDEGINSLADIRADYNKVFSDKYEDALAEVYMESNGRAYALDGARGANIYYTGSKVTAVNKITDSEIFFTVENYYSGDDFNPEQAVTETEEFSAVIDEDGTWRAGIFMLPY